MSVAGACTFPDPIPSIIPFGTVTLFAGAPGVGKTAMIADWIQRWRTGKTIWGHPTNPPTDFYYIAGDRGWNSHQQWFDAVGFPDIKHYSLADDPTLSLERLANPANAFKMLEDSINKLAPQPGGHLFVDPLAPLFIPGDGNRSRDVAIALIRLSRECRKREINITCCAHFSKQKSDADSQYRRPMDRISGSLAFVGFSDTQIYLIDPAPPEQPYHIVGWRPRHHKEEMFKVVRNDQGLFVPYAEEGGGNQMLLALIPDNQSIAAGELESLVFESLGMSRPTFFRRLNDLQEAGLIERHAGRIVKRVLH